MIKLKEIMNISNPLTFVFSFYIILDDSSESKISNLFSFIKWFASKIQIFMYFANPFILSVFLYIIIPFFLKNYWYWYIDILIYIIDIQL